MRQIAAILIAPLTPALAVILIAMLVSMSWPFNQSDYKIIIAVACAVSYMGFFIIGVPLIIILRKYSDLTLRSFAVSGGVSGIAVFGLAHLLTALASGSSAQSGLLTIIWGFSCGLCVSVSYALLSGITSR